VLLLLCSGPGGHLWKSRSINVMTHQGHGSVTPHRGVLILVLGILSIVLCTLLGPIVWMLGKGDLAQIDAGQMDPEGRSLTQAGMVCGIVGTALLAFGLLMVVIYVILVLALGFGAAASM
jgi:hypothetical protein